MSTRAAQHDPAFFTVAALADTVALDLTDLARELAVADEDALSA